MRVSTNEVHKPNRNVMPVIGDGAAIQLKPIVIHHILNIMGVLKF